MKKLAFIHLLAKQERLSHTGLLLSSITRNMFLSLTGVLSPQPGMRPPSDFIQVFLSDPI